MICISPVNCENASSLAAVIYIMEALLIVLEMHSWKCYNKLSHLDLILNTQSNIWLYM